LHLQYQSLVGSLNWLVHTTRPDISPAVSMLALHQSHPSSGHLASAQYVVQYLANTKTLGIYFTGKKRSTLELFLHFPILDEILAMTDVNWGPQDASITNTTPHLPLFISRSMSAFYIDLLGPIHWMSRRQKVTVHWMSRRQKVTAVSSAEAEIYATDECV
jgi:hypothetical protein